MVSLGSGAVNSAGEALFSTSALSADTHIIQLTVTDAPEQPAQP